MVLGIRLSCYPWLGWTEAVRVSSVCEPLVFVTRHQQVHDVHLRSLMNLYPNLSYYVVLLLSKVCAVEPSQVDLAEVELNSSTPEKVFPSSSSCEHLLSTFEAKNYIRRFRY